MKCPLNIPSQERFSDCQVFLLNSCHLFLALDSKVGRQKRIQTLFASTIHIHLQKVIERNMFNSTKQRQAIHFDPLCFRKTVPKFLGNSEISLGPPRIFFLSDAETSGYSCMVHVIYVRLQNKNYFCPQTLSFTTLLRILKLVLM